MSSPIAREEIPDDAEIIDAEGVRWRQVPGHPHYNISSIGTVMNHTTGRLLSMSLVGGYAVVALIVAGKPRVQTTHRLVAKAFLHCPEEGGYTVDHLDRVKVNNDLSNLKWATASEQAHNRAPREEWVARVPPPSSMEWRAIPTGLIGGEEGWEMSSKGAWLRYRGTGRASPTRKPSLQRNTGYCWHSIKGKRRSAHRLVASAWIGEIPDKHVVDHIDEVPSNNDVSNLRIVTRSENGNHSRVVSVAIEQRSEKTGDIIATFNSMKAAARVTETERGSISSAVARGIRVKSQKDGRLYYWSMKGTLPLQKPPTVQNWSRKRKPVTQHASENGPVLKRFRSGYEAGKSTGSLSSNISEACRRERGSVLSKNDDKRYFWRFA